MYTGPLDLSSCRGPFLQYVWHFQYNKTHVIKCKVIPSDEEVDDCVPISWQWLLANSKASRIFWVHLYNNRRSYVNTIKPLLNELRNYVQKPNAEKYLEITDGFERQWNFLSCLFTYSVPENWLCVI